jgi:tRNA threonylcarbamoyladenosine biosynthesis protein TsaE
MRDTGKFVVSTHSPGETHGLGVILGQLVRPGLVMVLRGQLGAGKTCLAQGVGRGLGIEDPIKSPTFTLVHEYQGRLAFYHLDLFRLDGPELEGIGLEEYLDVGGVTLVEWGEKAAWVLPADRLEIEITLQPGVPHARTLSLSALGAGSLEVLRELEAVLDRPGG